MFSNIKPTFGAPSNNTSFAFSSNVNPNPFGQSTFGKPATPGFGTQSTGFGSTGNTLFGSTTQHASPFATGTQTATFGQATATQPAFGTGMFGGTSAQPSGSGLFGTANTAFGQQNKPAGFGFGSTAANTGFFGQTANQVQTQQPTPGIFGQTTPNLFGNPSGFGSPVGNVQMGTVIKFTPVTGTDTMVKGSINQTISTRHHCITCMKEYENKSLEELRWEDYQANRKGPQQGAQPAGGLFASMAQPSSSLFGGGVVATAGNTLFGQTDNKSVFGTGTQPGFGQPNPGFGTPSAANTTGLFGKTISGFGTNTSNTATFPFNSNTQTNIFGTNTGPKPFGSTTQPNNIFGQSTAGFGTQSTFGPFGTGTNQNVGLFNQNKTTPFTMGQTTGTGFGAFGQPPASSSSLFPGTKSSTGFGGFGNTPSTSLFGQTTFGQTNQPLFGSTFNKSTAPLFGQSNPTNTLGTMGSGTSLFGNTANKAPNMFGSNLGMFNSGFGATNINTSFGMNGINVQPGATNADPNQSNAEQHILSMSYTPYGIPKLFNDVSEVDNDLKDLTRPTNPSELNALLNTVNKPPCDAPIDKLQPVHVFGKKLPMFDGLERKDESLISNFRINTNPKRLILRNRDSELENSSSKLSITWTDSDLTLGDSGSMPRSSGTRLSCVSDSSREKENKEPEEPALIERQKLLREVSSFSMLPIHKQALNENSEDVNKEDDSDSFIEAKDSLDWPEETSVIVEDSDSEDISNNTNMEPHPTGIVLTRSEYYTVPSMDELVKFISEDGSCIVKGFTVGRVGYGNVYFPEAFDVSNLDLDELVHFRHREINIYPNDAKKPPQGQGLNRKAQVTLDKVWPYDKKAKMLITDTDSLNKMEYASRLRRLCEKQSTRFVEYRPDTGSWVFKVEHFSKYGQPDSEDSDEEIGLAKKIDPKDLQVFQSKEAKSGLQKPSLESVSDMSVSSKDSFGLPDTIAQMNASINTAIAATDSAEAVLFESSPLSWDDSKFHLMRNAFFEDTPILNENSLDLTELQHAKIEMSQFTPGSSPKRPDMYTEEEDEIDDSFTLEILDVELDVSSDASEEPECVFLSVIQGVVPMSFSAVNNYNVADTCAFKDRSFKVGWGKNMIFTCITTRNAVEQPKSTLETILEPRSPVDYSQNLIQLVSLTDLSTSHLHIFENSIEQYLSNQLLNSQFEIINDVPYFSSVMDYQLLKDHQNLLKDKPVTNYHRQIWNLCFALWGELDEEDLRYYNMKHLRSSQFSAWLKDVVSEKVTKSLNDLSSMHTSSLITENILNYLSGNRLEEASEAAFQLNNFNLSLLIPQLPMSMSTRVYMEKQLQTWNNSNGCKYIENNLLKMYMLFAGKPSLKSDDNWVHIYENMDWLRSLAMYFWYIIDPAKSLSEAVLIYEETFKTYDCAKPIPSYLEESEKIYDLRFQLLKFYSDNAHPLVQVLNPASYTDNPLDYRLSWLLLQILSSLGYSDISKEAKDHIHTNFAAQLERIGLWHWAIFVLLFIENTQTKRLLIMNIIEKHVQLLEQVTDDYRDREKMLVDSFHIPREWIDSAKATLALLHKKYDEAVFYLYYAKQWHKAHDIIMDHLVPDHFLCYDYEFLIRLLNPISAYKKLLSNWDTSGGLILDFSNLCVLFNDAIIFSDFSTLKNNLMHIRSIVANIGSRLEQFTRTTYIHDVCLAEMCGRIAVMLRKLLTLMEGKTLELCISAAINAQSLPMSADYLKQEMNDILIDFLNLHQSRRGYCTSINL